MYELKKIGKVFRSKFAVTGPSSYKKIIFRAAVSQKLRNAVLEDPLENRGESQSVWKPISAQSHHTFITSVQKAVSNLSA